MQGTLRRLLSPLVPGALRRRPRLLRLLNRRCGGKVLQGPFAGMRYLEESHGSVLWPKLLGTYELEIAETLERWLQDGFVRGFVAGAAEGYYAVGLAVRCPEATVVAWESDAGARRLLRQLAGLNRADGRVEVRGRCNAEDLEASLRGVPQPLVVLDVEGDESSLLDLGRVPSLAGARILVETHEFLVPGVNDLLEVALGRTHTLERVEQRSRVPEDARAANVPRAFETQLLDLLSELRPLRNAWLVCEPRRA